MKWNYALIMSGILLLTNVNLQAQYKGPGSTPRMITTQEVIKNAGKLDRTDTLVQLEGTVAEQINPDTYLFMDESGKIRIEMSKKLLSGVSFDQNTRIKIIGEVDYDLLEGVEIEVKSIVIL